MTQTSLLGNQENKVELRVGVLIDLGNSRTRATYLIGDKGYRINLSNRYAELPENYKIKRKYSNKLTTNFYVNGVLFSNGQLVEREFVGVEIRPTSNKAKTEQLPTSLTLNLIFVHAYTLLFALYPNQLHNYNLVFDVSVLLPPEQQEYKEAEMIKLVRDITEVSVFSPITFTAPVTIGEVNVFSEAVAGLFGAFFTEGGALQYDNTGKNIEAGDFIVFDNRTELQLVNVPENDNYTKGFILVMDIGAGTTDLAMFKDMELLENSRETIDLGGNYVERNIEKALKVKLGFKPQNFERVIQEAVAEEGSVEHDVSKEVTDSKKMYAQAMQLRLQEYLERLLLDFKNVKGILVMGGGSLPSYRDGLVVSPAMNDVLIKDLQALAPNIQLVHTTGKNLREMNINGLLFIHKYA